MTFDLKAVFLIPGETLPVLLEYDAQELSIGGQYPFKKPIRVSGDITNKSGVVRISLAMSFTMELTCDRCLESFTEEHNMPVRYLLVCDPNYDGDNAYIAEGMSLDMDELIESTLILELPTKFVCDEDCKGLEQYNCDN